MLPCEFGEVVREKGNIKLVECLRHGGFIVTVHGSKGGYHYETKQGAIQGFKATVRSFGDPNP